MGAIIGIEIVALILMIIYIWEYNKSIYNEIIYTSHFIIIFPNMISNLLKAYKHKYIPSYYSLCICIKTLIL